VGGTRTAAGGVIAQRAGAWPLFYRPRQPPEPFPSRLARHRGRRPRRPSAQCDPVACLPSTVPSAPGRVWLPSQNRDADPPTAQRSGVRRRDHAPRRTLVRDARRAAAAPGRAAARCLAVVAARASAAVRPPDRRGATRSLPAGAEGGGAGGIARGDARRVDLGRRSSRRRNICRFTGSPWATPATRRG
jgi:hypothetical protein